MSPCSAMQPAVGIAYHHLISPLSLSLWSVDTELNNNELRQAVGDCVQSLTETTFCRMHCRGLKLTFQGSLIILETLIRKPYLSPSSLLGISIYPYPFLGPCLVLLFSCLAYYFYLLGDAYIFSYRFHTVPICACVEPYLNFAMFAFLDPLLIFCFTCFASRLIILRLFSYSPFPPTGKPNPSLLGDHSYQSWPIKPIKVACQTYQTYQSGLSNLSNLAKWAY